MSAPAPAPPHAAAPTATGPSRLFSPARLGPLLLANRIVVAPMCQYSCEEGLAGDWHLMHIGQLALSGAGLFILEATAVTREGRITPGCLGLWNDEHEAALGRVLGVVRRHSEMPVGIQLAHAGRKGSSEVPWRGGMLIPPDPASLGGWVPVAPSALPHAEGEAAPATLDEAGLARIRQGFADAARRAHRIGIAAIELHSAHGYLLHQFLSPVSNRRIDRYGGSLANRMRFPLEVFEAVREAVPASVPVGVRLSATDWLEHLGTPSWDLEQSIAYAHALRERGVSFLHVSSGGISAQQKIPLGPGYQVHLAERLKRETGLPTIAVGLITEPEQAEAIVAEGRADFVALARALLFNPHWPWAAALKLGAQVNVPAQYWRAAPRGAAGLFGQAKIGMR
ncbi:MAG: NADH:flavin oxidoreductase/NADH oxidase [Rubrivivax sp.]|nr:NADH:flavin oxidoreductase/NADH oxidase [Rubrivivax sp.]